LDVGGSRAEQLESALAILDAMKLSSRLEDPPERLTLAAVQRLALAVALVNGPRLLLADELTAGLEWAAARELLADLDVGLNRSGAAAIIVTHDPRLQSYVERAIVIRDGTIRVGS
jgi:ABC-type lipoprotein export system ATPase subunit